MAQRCHGASFPPLYPLPLLNPLLLFRVHAQAAIVVRRHCGTPPHDVNEPPCFSLPPQLADQVITNPLDSDTTDDGQSHGGYTSKEAMSDSSYLSVPEDSSACDTDDNHREDRDDFGVAASLSEIQVKTGEREASLEQTQTAVRNLQVTLNPSHPETS